MATFVALNLSYVRHKVAHNLESWHLSFRKVQHRLFQSRKNRTRLRLCLFAGVCDAKSILEQCRLNEHSMTHAAFDGSIISQRWVIIFVVVYKSFPIREDSSGYDSKPDDLFRPFVYLPLRGEQTVVL